MTRQQISQEPKDTKHHTQKQEREEDPVTLTSGHAADRDRRIQELKVLRAELEELPKGRKIYSENGKSASGFTGGIVLLECLNPAEVKAEVKKEIAKLTKKAETEKKQLNF